MTGDEHGPGEMQRRDRLASRLQQRVMRAGLSLPPALVDRLCAYVELLQRWNARMNLTALDDGDHGLDRLVIEPLAAARHVQVAPVRMIDIGSGSGSPAIPLRMALGGGSLLMVEARMRKAAFLREAIRRLELEGAAVEAVRFENLAAQPRRQGAFDLLTVRGVKTGPQELRQLQDFVRDGGELLLFKGESGDCAPSGLQPPLEARAAFPLVESLGSRVLVLHKKPHRGE